MWPKRTHTISTIVPDKKHNKKPTNRSFQFCFQIWELQRKFFNIFFGFCSAVSRNCRKHWPNAWKLIFLLLIQWNGPYDVINLITWDKLLPLDSNNTHKSSVKISILKLIQFKIVTVLIFNHVYWFCRIFTGDLLLTNWLPWQQGKV